MYGIALYLGELRKEKYKKIQEKLLLPLDDNDEVWYVLSMRRKSIVTELRKAIVESGYTQNQLSELSGVNRAQINRFVKGERTLTLESAEKIAKVLKLELKKRK